MVLAVFGAVWVLAGAGVAGLDGLARSAIWAVTALVAISLCLAGLRLIWAARALPHDASRAARSHRHRVNRLFGLVFGLEIALIVVATNTLRAWGLDRLVPPVVAVIVGVHFLPLARIFEVPIYYATGTALILIGGAGLAGTAGTSTSTWPASVAFASALVVWLTAAVSLGQAYRTWAAR
jgi:hypothetical protein